MTKADCENAAKLSTSRQSERFFRLLSGGFNVHTLGCLSRIHGWKLAVKVQCDESPDKPATYKPATNMLSRMQNQGTIMKSHMLSLSARKNVARKSSRMLECALGVTLLLAGSLGAQQNVELTASGEGTASTIPSNQAN